MQVTKMPQIQNSTRNIWHEVHYLALATSAYIKPDTFEGTEQNCLLTK